MCSDICPCDPVALAPWFALEEEYLNTFNRTKIAGSSWLLGDQYTEIVAATGNNGIMSY